MSQKNKSWLNTALNTFTLPGGGVYTVHTGGDKKLSVLQALYQCSESDFEHCWRESLQNYPQSKRIGLYGIASDTGGGILRGANWGPLALRDIIFTRETHRAWSDCFVDLGDVRVHPQILLDEYLNEKTLQSCKLAMYGDAQSSFSASPLSIARDYLALHHQEFPNKKLFMLGGDHSVSYPAVLEFLKAKRSQGKNPAVLHFDAHTDLLDQRLGISICFGSWVSHVLPEMKDRSQWIQLGIRSSGKSKEHWEKTKGIRQFWSNEISNRTSASIADEIKSHFKAQNVDSLYISFDIDALDLSEASATGTPERGGLKTQDCIQIIDSIGSEFSIDGADLTEVAPFVRHPHSNANEPETTLENAALLIRAITDRM